MLFSSIRFRNSVLFLADSCSIFLFCYLVCWLALPEGKAVFWLELVLEFSFITLLCQIIFSVNGLHKLEGGIGLIDLVLKAFITIISISFILTIYYLSFPYHILSNGLYLYVMLLTLFSIIGWRVLFKWSIYKLDLTEKVVVLGSGSMARIVVHELLKKDNSSYKLEGLIDNSPKHIGKKIMGQEIIGLQNNLLSLVNDRKINKIVVALNQRRGMLPITELLTCKLRGTDIIDTPDFYERITGKILIKDLRPSWLIFSSGFRKTNTLRIIKRILDIFFSVIGLIVFSPISFISAVIIKLDSRGPVFFTQTRVGEYGKPYTIYKFRSMTFGAEKEKGPTWAEVNDCRITRFGRVIRRMRIDEVPQIINVLKGEMSFVGPRPEREFFINQLQKRIPYYTQRLMVKPGITGWSAVNAQYTSSIEAAVEKLQYDLYYVKNMSIYLDLLIMLKTVKIILSGKGSR